MKILQIGDKVLCRYFSNGSKRFYGEYFQAELINIKKGDVLSNNIPSYIVKKLDNENIIPLYRKEIRDVIEDFDKEDKSMEKIIETIELGNILESDLWQSLEEAKKILRFVYNELSNMTTEKFSYGGDMEIREKIRDFLGIKK